MPPKEMPENPEKLFGNAARPDPKNRRGRPRELLDAYFYDLGEIQLLDADEEERLARASRDEGDKEAADRLVTSHLPLAAKLARGFKGYGLPISDLMSEANLGLLEAVKRFDPDRGNRFSTYARWWIKAFLYRYVTDNWSLVGVGTTPQRKRLFFNLRRMKYQLQAPIVGELPPEILAKIAQDLDASEEDVIDMNIRMTGGDHSLNTPLSANSEDGDDSKDEWLDRHADGSDTYESTWGVDEEKAKRLELLQQLMQGLSERERDILTERRLKEDPATLDDLAKRYKISSSRVRQIEFRAFDKLQERFDELAMSSGLPNALEYSAFDN